MRAASFSVTAKPARADGVVWKSGQVRQGVGVWAVLLRLAAAVAIWVEVVFYPLGACGRASGPKLGRCSETFARWDL